LFAEGGAGDAAKNQNQDQWTGLGGMLLPFALIFMVFYFLMIRPQKREQNRRQEMLGAVKKNDRVVTIGGIYGVVANVQREADEVTLKVDETTNTKLRITLGSIARVLGDEPSDESATKDK
jgi:preprotein translocase subunit YajC